jgi:hypothetical protein
MLLPEGCHRKRHCQLATHEHCLLDIFCRLHCWEGSSPLASRRLLDSTPGAAGHVCQKGTVVKL